MHFFDRISTGKWGLVTMKKKLVGRNKRVKRETGLRSTVVADLERGMATTVLATNPGTRQITKENGVRRGTEAEAQRSPETKKSLSTDERRGADHMADMPTLA
jgi:hypothetical protein